jgi:SAM-dependent methyltransferase
MNRLQARRPVRRQLRRLARLAVAPLLRDYVGAKVRTRFTEKDKAYDLLAPLMTGREDENYHRFHMERYLSSLEYLADLPKHTRVLEIGAPPYGMTLMLRNWLFDDVAVSGYDEKSRRQYERTSEERVTIRRADGTVLFDGIEHRFNLEIHRWPLPDDNFDLIVCCETFEHLGLDPMHAYSEANRVLKTGGRLFITVPNGLALTNGVRYLSGRQPNSFTFYRPEGFSLRHQREPTPGEIECLLRAAGFTPEFVETLNVVPPDTENLSLVRLLALGLFARPLNRRRELIAARGIKCGPVIERYPTDEDLYYPWDVERLRRQTERAPEAEI